MTENLTDHMPVNRFVTVVCKCGERFVEADFETANRLFMHHLRAEFPEWHAERLASQGTAELT